MQQAPTIKGLFVKTHIAAVKHKRGEQGVKILEKLFGKPLAFGNWENVPVEEEVRLIHYALHIWSDEEIVSKYLEYEAGRFHFRNFLTTPLAKTIIKRFGANFKLIMMLASKIARKVFLGIEVSSENIDLHKVKIIIKNSAYPLEHFSGFFEAWLSYVGLVGMVRAVKTNTHLFEYTIIWKTADQKKLDKS